MVQCGTPSPVRHPDRSEAKWRDLLSSGTGSAAQKESRSFDSALRAALRMTKLKGGLGWRMLKLLAKLTCASQAHGDWVG